MDEQYSENAGAVFDAGYGMDGRYFRSLKSEANSLKQNAQ